MVYAASCYILGRAISRVCSSNFTNSGDGARPSFALINDQLQHLGSAPVAINGIMQ